MGIGQRLKEERERLGFTIPAFAAIAGAKKNTVIDWQKNLSSPPAAKLAELDKVGLDVLYVVTGRRSRAASSGVHVQQNFHPGVKIGQNAGHNIINRGRKK